MALDVVKCWEAQFTEKIAALLGENKMTLTRILHGQDTFDSLKPEGERLEDRKSTVLSSDIKDGFDRVIRELKSQGNIQDISSTSSYPNPPHYRTPKEDYDISRQEKVYKSCLDAITRPHSREEIAKFFTFEARTFAHILDYTNINPHLAVLGLYTSALINTSRDREHHIFIPTVPDKSVSDDHVELGFLGYRNVKDIRIEGGNIPLEDLAVLMQEGNISIDNLGTGLVNGKGLVKTRDAGLLMSGGTLHIGPEIHNELCLGSYMSGGKIISDANISLAGRHMSGGRIDVPSLEGAGFDMSGGTINAGECRGELGYNMRGGLIRISKHFGRPYKKVLTICKDMRGGEIRIGESTDLKISTTARKGEIYYADKLLWKDGVRIE